VPYLLADAGDDGWVLTGWDGLGLDLVAGAVEEIKTMFRSSLLQRQTGCGISRNLTE